MLATTDDLLYLYRHTYRAMHPQVSLITNTNEATCRAMNPPTERHSQQSVGACAPQVGTRMLAAGSPPP